MSAAKHKLQRFLSAQEPVYKSALRELVVGRKQGHWMWFIFPQLFILMAVIKRRKAHHSNIQEIDGASKKATGETGVKVAASAITRISLFPGAGATRDFTRLVLALQQAGERETSACSWVGNPIASALPQSG